MLYYVNKCEANCEAISAVAYGDFLAKSLQNRRKRQIWQKVSLGCKKQIYKGCHTWNNNLGKGAGGGGVKCDLIYPCIHQNESESESQGEAFRALFRDWK